MPRKSFYISVLFLQDYYFIESIYLKSNLTTFNKNTNSYNILI